MPYIKNERRECICNDQEKIIRYSDIQNAGELNFALSKILLNYFNMPGKGNYQAINDIVGAVEGCKLEFTRRITNGYEDTKIKENGDMY